MQTFYRALAAQSKWRGDGNTSFTNLSKDLGALIRDNGSLTQALVSLSDGAFSVDVLSQDFEIPYWHEQKKMGRPYSRAAMVREVELKIFDEAVVYARSVIPLSLTSRGRTGLANLGRTPLGHLLFKDGKIRVSKRDFSLIDIAEETVAARRTPYDYQGAQILVSEFFLPAILKYL